MDLRVQSPIHVTRSFLPPREEFDFYVDKIWESGQLTNRGPLLREFEEKISDYLQVDNFQFVTNGTLAIQLALDGLGIDGGEIITTPFSYVASTSAILWQRCKPVFVDIDVETLNIDPLKIEAAITSKTKAILAVHVFGNACDIESIQDIADRHNLRVIYDGAHSFGAGYGSRSLLDYGDVSIVSFHATKLFHTIEGGGIICKDKKVHDKIDLKKRFGHNNDEHVELGINAKANEFQAAMGLVNLRHIDEIIKQREELYDIYTRKVGSAVRRPQLVNNDGYNYSYYPVIFKSENELNLVLSRLKSLNIFPRRYFYPSLNRLPYLEDTSSCVISEDISRRILCLPFYSGIDKKRVNKMLDVIVSVCE